MKITERHEDGIIVFVIEGRVDSQGAIDLDNALQTAVDNGHYRLVCDMGNVAFINSAALRTLADIISRTRANNGDLRLAALPPKVRRVLQIVGFDRYSAIFETTEEALQNF